MAHKIQIQPIFALVFALLAANAGAQSESLLIKRATTLRNGPADTAVSVANLAAQAPVSKLPLRQGPWLQVKTADGQTGWVHMFDIGTPPTQSTASSTAAGALRGLTNFFNRGSAQGGPTTSTSTVGIRGLGAEDLAGAQPNTQAVTQMEALREDAAQATRYARDVSWIARDVAALPEPAMPPAAPAANKKEAF